MRKIFLSLAAIALLGAGCQSSSTPDTTMPPAANTPSGAMPVNNAPAPKPVTSKVDIKDTAFSPQQLAIKPGDTVTWTNAGKTNHTVTGLDAVLVWDSGNLAPGKQFSYTFPQPGVYKYHDNIAGLQGEIIVGEVQPQTR